MYSALAASSALGKHICHIATLTV